MKKRYLAIWPITTATLAFLLNWLVFVDSSAITKLMQHRSNILLDFNRATLLIKKATEREINVLTFQTNNYIVRVFRRTDQYYMNVYNKKTSGESLHAAPVIVANSHEGIDYMHKGEITFIAFESRKGGRQLMILGGGQPQVEQEVSE